VATVLRICSENKKQRKKIDQEQVHALKVGVLRSEVKALTLLLKDKRTQFRVSTNVFSSSECCMSHSICFLHMTIPQNEQSRGLFTMMLAVITELSTRDINYNALIIQASTLATELSTMTAKLSNLNDPIEYVV
jgi:hypothetical protein